MFAGKPPYYDCADRLDVSSEACSETKICVLDSSTHIDILLKLIPDATIVVSVNNAALYSNFLSGFCNVIAGEQFDVAESNLRNRYVPLYCCLSWDYLGLFR